jgi:hypothetical protein
MLIWDYDLTHGSKCFPVVSSVGAGSLHSPAFLFGFTKDLTISKMKIYFPYKIADHSPTMLIFWKAKKSYDIHDRFSES